MMPTAAAAPLTGILTNSIVGSGAGCNGKTFKDG
jgi:hypothetical protein